MSQPYLKLFAQLRSAANSYMASKPKGLIRALASTTDSRILFRYPLHLAHDSQKVAAVNLFYIVC